MQPLEKVTIPVHDPLLRKFLWRAFITSMQPYGPAQNLLIALQPFENRLIEQTDDDFWNMIVVLLQEWETLSKHTEGFNICATCAARFGIVFSSPLQDTRHIPKPSGGGLGVKVS